MWCVKFVVFALFSSLLIFTPVNCEIKGVALLFRHGQRTPVSSFPNYGVLPEYEDLGLGQLTLQGSRQLYDNGVDLRQRYLSLFPKSGYYQLSNMRILSSTSERCVESLTSFLAGFFPPPTTDKTIPFRWQSIPFAQDNEARVVTFDRSNCPAFTAAHEVASKSVDYNGLLAADKSILPRIANYMGAPMTSFQDVYLAAELIRSNQYLDPSTPQWLLEYYEKYLKKYLVKMIDGYHATKLMKQVRGGPMLAQMVDNMFAIRNGNETARNFLIFSAHDMTVTSLLYVLGAHAQLSDLPNYADTIAIELHQTSFPEPLVQVWYFSSTAKVPFKKQLNIPLCSPPCTLAKFSMAVEQFFVRDWDKICGL